VTSLSVYAPVPAVHAITPQTGENEGITGGCRIAGSGFLPGVRVQLTKAGKSPVTAAGVQYAGSSLLTCDFDLTGIAVGTWSVQVRNSDGQAATGTGLFTVLPSPSRPAPTVARIQPPAFENIGRQTGVTITGTGFRSGASVALTRSGQAPVPADTVTVADATRLTCAFDATRMTPGSWSVTVTNADDQAGIGRDLLTIEAAGPAIATMTPAAGSIIGTATVTVTGTGFQPGTTLKLVTGATEVAATDVVVNGWSSITGTFDLRGLATGSFDVRATNPDGKQSLAAGAFRVLAMPPSVGPSVNPTSTYRTTTTFTLGGAHFQPGATVRLLLGINNPYPARNVVVNSPTSLTFVLDLPDTFPPGMWDVEVTNPDGQKGVRPGLIQLQDVGLLVTIHISNVSPATGFNDRSLTVNFKAEDWLDRYIDFIYLQRDGYPIVKATSMSLPFRNYSCTFDLSGVATGTWNLCVHRLDGRSESGATLQVVPPPPLVTALTPNSGINTGPKLVNIGGYGFTGDSSVRLFRTGRTPIPGTIESLISSASMDCRFDLTGAETAPWDVVVTNPQGHVATLPGGFMILPPAATYASMTPAFGANTNPAFALQITGAGFKEGTGVYLERDQRVVRPLTVVRSGYFLLTATFDLTDLAVGPWTLGLEVPGEAPLVAPDTFLVKAQPPTLTSITPAFGLNEAASTTVTIRGTGFHPGILVRLVRDAQLPVAGTDVTLNGTTELTCDFALSGKALGAWTPVVENADGGLGSLAGAFTVYLATPLITSVSVSTGKVYTNLALPINGSGFADGAAVRLVNASFTIAATQVVRTSTNLLTATFPGENLRPGVFNVEVTNPNSMAGLGQNLVTISDLPPVVHVASPSSDMNDRVVPVTLTGLSFQTGSQFRLTRTGHTPVSAVAPVVTLFMPRPYSPYTIQTDKITGNINLTGLATGTWNVEVINPDGQTGSKAGAFTVLKAVASPPTVSAVSPNAGFNIGILQNVQVTGTNFATGASMRLTRAGFAAVAGSDVTVTGSNTLTCSFDLAGVATGAWNVEATNPDGQTATGANLLTVVSPAWRKSLGGTGAESDLFCVAAPEGGYYVAGTTSSSDGDMTGFNGGTADVWIARITDAGAIVWSKCFGGTGDDTCSALVVTPGGFVLAGDTTSPDGPLCPGTPDATKRAWAAEFDTTGTFVRINHFALPYQSQPSDARGGLRRTADGGFILAGTVSDGAYWYGWAVKFDALLQEQWQQRLAANSGMAYSYDVAQKPDGNFLLCGYTEFGAGAFAGTGYHASNDGFVFELASDTGSPVRGICLGGTGSDRCTGIVPLPDGGLYAIGTTGSSDGTCPSANGGSDVMIVKLQSDFTIAWSKSVGGSQAEEGFRGRLAADGDLLYMGRSTSTDGDCVGNHSLMSDFWLGKCSPTGSLQWQRFFGGGLEDTVTDVVLAPDGGYLIGGYGRSDDGDFAGIGHRTGNSEFVLIREPETIIITP